MHCAGPPGTQKREFANPNYIIPVLCTWGGLLPHTPVASAWIQVCNREEQIPPSTAGVGGNREALTLAMNLTEASDFASVT